MSVLHVTTATVSLETRAMMNLGGNESGPAFYINALKATSWVPASADIPNLDDDGYPTTTLSADTTFTSAAAVVWPSVQYKLAWPATRTFRITFSGVYTSVSSSNATISGGAGNNMTVSSQAGLAGYVIFTTTATSFSGSFPSTGTYAAGSGEIALYRVSDETDYLTGKYFTPEFVTVLQNCAPRGIRPMGWVNPGSGNVNGETAWAYRSKPSSLSWRRQYKPSMYGGTIGGTDAYAASAATDTPGSWTAGEQYQGVISNAATRITISGAANNGSGLVRLTVSSTATLSTGQVVWIFSVGGTTEANGRPTITVIDGTHVDLQGVSFVNAYTSGGILGSQTINIGLRGPKFLGNNCGQPFFTQSALDGPTSSNTLATLTYDAVIDAVLYNAGGLIPTTVPIEAQVQLANDVGCHLWGTVPVWATDDYVTQWAAVVKNNLNASLKFYPEYSNEIWNNPFPQTPWAFERGKALGWAATSNQATYGWYGLRVREIMGTLIPAVFSGQMSRLRRVMAYQGGGDTSNINNRFKGIQLVPGNAAYNTYTGSSDYSVSPNRPIDVCEVIAYAPYAGGTHLCYGPDNNQNFTPNASNGVYYQSIIDAWDGGNSAAAIALVDADVRSGRMNVNNVTASGTTFTTRDGGGTPVVHNLVVQARVWFTATGGTLYSGVTEYKMYEIVSVPTTSTFTMREFVGNNGTGSAIDAGSAGSGTMTVGRTNVTLVDITRMHLFAESLAATFDGDRPAGMSNLAIEQYEGALEPKGPSSAQCTTLGLAGSDPAASIAAAIIAWKNDSSSATTIQDYYKQALGLDASMPNTFGLMAHQVATSQLILAGAGDWGVLSGNFPNSTPYKTYDGFAAFNNA